MYDFIKLKDILMYVVILIEIAQFMKNAATRSLNLA